MIARKWSPRARRLALVLVSITATIGFAAHMSHRVDDRRTTNSPRGAERPAVAASARAAPIAASQRGQPRPFQERPAVDELPGSRQLSDHQMAYVRSSLAVLRDLERRAVDGNNLALKAQVDRERVRLVKAAAGLPPLSASDYQER